MAYPIVSAHATLVSKYYPTMCVVRDYAGGDPAEEALMRGDIDAWNIACADIGTAYNDGKNIRLLTGGFYPALLAFMVRANDGITTVKDFAGRRCAVVSDVGHEATEIKAIMDWYGVWDTAIKMDAPQIPDVPDLMISKKADVVWFAMAIPVGLQIKQATGVDHVSLDDGAIEAAVKATPGDFAWQAPKWCLDMYGYPADRVIKSVAFTGGIAVRPDMPNFVAYGLMAALFGEGHSSEVTSLSPAVSDISLALGTTQQLAPYHPGAIQYFKDRGVWTDAMQQKNDELLAKFNYEK